MRIKNQKENQSYDSPMYSFMGLNMALQDVNNKLDSKRTPK